MTARQIALIQQAIAALTQNATFPADVALALRSLNEALEIEQDGF